MDVSTWLRDLGLEDYVRAFQANHIDAKVLPRLTADDLTALGITSVGHRRTLLDAIAALDEGRPTATAEPIAATTRPVHAERRQLTVLFCDLVGSTELAARLDPEDLRGIMGAYQRCAAAVVERFGGHVAKYLGDGVLAYFGWPQAHEDDAERAVRAGLDLVDAVARLEQDARTKLRARIGIATGQVVVGDLVGEGAARDEAVVGETPNLAARLQALAAPGSVVISQATRRLVGGLFELTELGPLRLKGFAEPLAAWRVEGKGRAEGRFEALHGRHLTPLVGREHELGILLERWAWANDGDGQVVLLSGEPGIGKSRVVQALRERLGDQPYTSQSHYCSPYYTNSALHPVIGLLERAVRLDRDEPRQQELARLEAVLGRSSERLDEVVPLLAALLGIPTDARYPPLTLAPEVQKRRTLQALIDQLAGLATKGPVLALYEDVQWIDPSTLELLSLVVERIRQLPVLVLITFRPEFQPPWTGHAHVTTLTMGRLGRRQGADLVARITGAKPLPAAMVEQIVARTDGVPLFIEELTKAVLESGLLTDAGDHYKLAGPLPPLAIPTTLHDSLMARLDRPGPVKGVAQIGAVIGREFSHELLAAVADQPEAHLNDALDQLVQSELIFRRGAPPEAIYSFKHALVQDAAYQSLLKTKRQQLHARIAEVIEERFPDVARTSPELLAHHSDEASLVEKAVFYWSRAARQSKERSAMVEAVAQSRNGLHLLGRLPEDAERSRKELELQLVLGTALIAAKGFAAPEAGDAYTRACELGRELGDIPKFLEALYGQFVFHWQRAELDAAHEVGRNLLRLAEEQSDGDAKVVGHRIFAAYLFPLGKFCESRDRAEAAIALYDPDHDQSRRFYSFDSRVICLDWLAHALLILGYPDDARERSNEALDSATKLAHPTTMAAALIRNCTLHLLLRDRRAAQAQADELIELTKEQGSRQRLAEGRVIRGWTLTPGGDKTEGIADITEGIAEIRQGLRDYRATGAELFSPYFLALLAEALRWAGRSATGLRMLRVVLHRLKLTRLRWIESELHRLRGELQLALPKPDQSEAEASFSRALAVASEQQAKFWELRAATSLARLWRDQRRRNEAHDLLAPIYGWFRQGFDTADLKDAKALLDELG